MFFDSLIIHMSNVLYAISNTQFCIRVCESMILKCYLSGVESDLQQGDDPSRAGERRPAGETAECFIT